MKKKLLTLLMLAFIFVCGVNAESHQVTGTEVVNLTKVDITAKSFITVLKDTWAANKTYCGLTGDFYNLSSADRGLSFTVSNVESFSFNVMSSNADRSYNIIVNDGAPQTIAHPGGGCVESDLIPTNSTGEITIKIMGAGTSVYPASITLNAPSGPNSDATIKTLTVAENEATATEGAYSYELPASFDGTSAEVVITPNSDKAIVTVGDTPNTVAGTYTANVTIGTPVTVKITPETGSGDAVTYTLLVTKATQKSSDTSLKSLTVDGTEVIAVEGNPDKYELSIPFAYDSPLAIVATPNDDLSNVSEITSPTVAAGTPVDVKFTVTAEDGNLKEYTLTITREVPSAACVLSSFSINGFIGTIDETAKTIAIKVVKNYDFSHTPVMSVSEKATAVWNKETKNVSITAEDGTTNAIYTVSTVSGNIAALDVFPTDLSFAAATYTQPVDWIYGAAYNELLKDAADTNVVGGYELKKESDNVGIDAGSNLLNIYLAKCGTLTVNVGATGGRYVVGLVDGVECGNVTLTKGNAANLVCTVNKNEPVVVSIRSYKDSGNTASTGGTRIYSLNAAAPQTPDNIGSINGDKGMSIYVADGNVYISAVISQIVNVYSIDGRLVRTVELTEGENVINGLAQGMYLINNQKVVVQ